VEPLTGEQKIQHSIGIGLRLLDVGEMRSIEHGEPGAKTISMNERSS
jgi:hypothetical protein